MNLLDVLFRRNSDPNRITAENVYGYNAVDHSHDWQEHESKEAYCPICGLWRSQIDAASSSTHGKKRK